VASQGIVSNGVLSFRLQVSEKFNCNRIEATQML